MSYVLVNDEDEAVSAEAAVDLVAEVGVKAAAEKYGVSDAKLRGFLNANGWRGKRSTVWAKTPQVPVPAGPEDKPF